MDKQLYLVYKMQQYRQLFLVQHLKVARSLCKVVEKGISGTYRLYMSLQIPAKDLSEDPFASHPPCFCYYVPYIRYCKYIEIDLDGILRRIPIPNLKINEYKNYEIKEGWLAFPKMELRANDYLAFPGNAIGGIKIQEIKFGAYTHSAACLHIVDYFLSKEEIEKLNKTIGPGGI